VKVALASLFVEQWKQPWRWSEIIIEIFFLENVMQLELSLLMVSYNGAFPIRNFPVSSSTLLFAPQWTRVLRANRAIFGGKKELLWRLGLFGGRR
jgi:hypothetical protein